MADAFQPFDGAAVAGSDASGGRFIRSGNTCLEAPVILPTGAVIDHMQLELCDHERDVDLVAALFSSIRSTRRA